MLAAQVLVSEVRSGVSYVQVMLKSLSNEVATNKLKTSRNGEK